MDKLRDYYASASKKNLDKLEADHIAMQKVRAKCEEKSLLGTFDPSDCSDRNDCECGHDWTELAFLIWRRWEDHKSLYADLTKARLDIINNPLHAFYVLYTNQFGDHIPPVLAQELANQASASALATT